MKFQKYWTTMLNGKEFRLHENCSCLKNHFHLLFDGKSQDALILLQGFSRVWQMFWQRARLLALHLPWNLMSSTRSVRKIRQCCVRINAIHGQNQIKNHFADPSMVAGKRLDLLLKFHLLATELVRECLKSSELFS